MANKKKEIKVIENKGRALSKYTEKLAKAITDDMTCMTIKKACKKNGISEDTYYRWIHIHKELSELSTHARETRATYHFDKAAEVIEELATNPNDEDTRVDIARLRFDGHLRLAGKANQGLYGDKGISINNNTQINNIRTDELVDERLLNLINVNKKEE